MVPDAGRHLSLGTSLSNPLADSILVLKEIPLAPKPNVRWNVLSPCGAGHPVDPVTLRDDSVTLRVDPDILEDDPVSLEDVPLTLEDDPVSLEDDPLTLEDDPTPLSL